MQPCPPCATYPRVVGSSPDNMTQSLPHISLCWLARTRSPVASFTPTMFGWPDRRAKVSLEMSQEVRAGTLYTISGSSTASATVM